MNDLKPTTLIQKKKKLIEDVLAAEYRSAKESMDYQSY
jgi:hypothetical protein